MHVMIDLETLSLRPDAAIIQIAAVAFEPVYLGRIPRREEALDIRIDPHSQERHIDPDTLRFWKDQTEQGNTVFLDSFIGRDTVSLPRALLQFTEWWRRSGPFECVWSHGAAFDLPILIHAFMLDGYDSPPWSHRMTRDTRTLYMAMKKDNHPELWERDELRINEFLGGKPRKHNALDDAVTQIFELQRAQCPAGETRVQ